MVLDYFLITSDKKYSSRMADLHAKPSAGVVTVIILVSSRPNDLWAHLLGIYAEWMTGSGAGRPCLT
jgi:hypothetical protein